MFVEVAVGRSVFVATDADVGGGCIVKSSIPDFINRYQSTQGYVYLVHAVGTNRYKIGRSVNPVARFETLKRQSPYPLQIIECFWSPDAIADEIGIHKIFAEHRIYGEWFELLEYPSRRNPYLGFVRDTFASGRPVVGKIARDAWDCLLQSIVVDETNLLEIVKKSRESWEEISRSIGSIENLSQVQIDELFRSVREDGLTKAHDCTSSLTFLYHKANSIETLSSVDYFTRKCLAPAVHCYGQITKDNIPYECLLCLDAAVESFEKFLFRDTPESVDKESGT